MKIVLAKASGGVEEVEEGESKIKERVNKSRMKRGRPWGGLSFVSL